jgi:DNA invertase Pin-like site-specific DNA recombinase
MANMLATFVQFERRLISQRTSEALAVKRASGVPTAHGGAKWYAGTMRQVLLRAS